MPPLPPNTVQIKRKRTDDPVELLHVHNEIENVRNIKQYIFKRQRTSSTFETHGLNPPPAVNPVRFTACFTGTRNLDKAPQVMVSKPGDEYRNPLRNELKRLGEQATNSQIPMPITTVPESAKPLFPPPVKAMSRHHEPRRFHMSREPVHNNGGVSGKIRGSKTPMALFMERINAGKAAKIVVGDASPKDGVLVSQSTKMAQQDTPTGPALSLTQSPNSPFRPLIGATSSNLKLSPSKERLNAAMLAYNMEDTDKSFAQSPKSVTKAATTFEIRKPISSKFKPKVPALRYHERHPETKTTPQKQDADADHAMVDAGDDLEDTEYIIDTYIRMPAESILVESSHENFGLLVLDSQPDIDEFYNDDSDDDSEIYDEEEDENAENHHSTDYPDDEVASDDEFGRNPYLYRNGNASENEEYDEDDATFSDDDPEETKRPWAKRPWMRGAYKTEVVDGEEEEEDL